MKHNEVILKPLGITDAPRLAELANNIKIWQQLRDLFPYPYTLEQAIGFIESASGGHSGLVRGVWYEQELAGVISLVPQPDVYRHNAEIGYWLGEPYWGKGIGTEAVRQMVLLGFNDQPELLRVFAGIFSSNPGSMRVLAKNGFQPEGVSPRAIFKNGTLLNEHRYGLLRTN